MSAYPTPVASATTRERLRLALDRVSALALEPNARLGAVLVVGPEGFQATELLREALEPLGAWTLVIGAAAEREHPPAWSFLEVLNGSLAQFGVQVETPLSTPDAPDDAGAVGRGLAHALAAIEGPVCLAIENAHLVDVRSADAIRVALQRPGKQAHLLAMSAEVLPDPAEQPLTGLAQSRPERNAVIQLPPLSVTDVQELAVELVRRPLAGRVARRFVTDTDGNPTLIAGLIQASRDELLQALHPAAIDLERPRIVPLLPRQRRALRAAPLGVRAACEIVAVLREPSSIAAVNRVATWVGLAGTFGAFDLEGAQRAGLVRVVEDAAVPTVAPPTRVAGDCIAAGIPIERRRAIHAAAADVLTGVAVMRHRVGAMDPDDIALVTDLMGSARKLAAVGDAERAMTLALAAVQLAAPGPEYEAAVLFAGVLGLRFHEHQRLFPLAGEIAALPESALREAILADLEVLSGNRDAGVELARAAIALADDSPTGRALRAHVAVMIPLYELLNDRHDVVRTYAAGARRLVAEAPTDPREVDVGLRWLVRPQEYELWLTAWELVAAARLRDTARLADRMMTLERLLHGSPDSPAAVDAIVYQARTFVYAGRVTDAANRLHRAIRVAAGYPDSWLRHAALTMQAHVLFLTGDWDQALATGHAAVDSAFDDPYRATLPIAYAVSGMVPAARGDASEVQRIERLLAMLPPSGGGAVPYDPDLPDVMRAELAAALGDPLAQLRATEMAHTADRRASTWSWLQLHVDALARLGRVAEATSIANEALAGGTPWIRTPQAVSRLRARIAAATGQHEAAAQLYAGIAKSSTAAAQPFALARDRLHYAETLYDLGETHRAIEQLELAATAFHALRAQTYLKRAVTRARELAGTEGAAPVAPPARTRRPAATPARAPGGTPAPASASPPAALAELTAREREVAIAVAGGLTNREVAEQLYVSITTVNFHVRNILAKLSLNSRRELRALVRDAGTDGRPGGTGGGPVRF
jgi:DNA-binding CsgD family transcriptional regulator/tetratricopeptide (TPR) repeat protein